MKAAKLLMSAAASAVLAGTANAQLPGAASPFGSSAPSSVLNGVVPPPGLGVGVGPGAQLPGQMSTIWSRLGISQEQREFCKRKICRTPAGQLLGRIQAPISTLTGGVIPPFCPIVPSIAELLDPGVVGAASKAKLDRAGAEERIKAIKYLGTLDCHYWPEAEEALIGALRGDRNECVRYEAALALARGCCCTCKVIVALSHVVSCSEADGFPYEKSARVRAVAANALDRCLQSSCCSPCGELPCLTGTPADEKKGVEDKKPGVEPGKTDKDKDKDKDDKDKKDKATKLGDPDFPKEYYKSVARMPRPKISEFGHKALEIGANIGYTATDEVNARDYAAAGLNVGRDGQSSGAKPTTIMELLTWKDNSASIGKELIGPPAAYAGRTAAMPATTVTTTTVTKVVPVPAAVPVPMATSPALPPAALASQTKPAPAKTSTEVPVVSLPSSNAAPRPLPQPLVVPTLGAGSPVPPIAVPPVKLSTPVNATVPPPKVTIPTPAPAPAKPVMQPTMQPAKNSPLPPVVAPMPPATPVLELPPVEKLGPPASATSLPPVEKIGSTAPTSNLPPVEKFTPGS